MLSRLMKMLCFFLCVISLLGKLPKSGPTSKKMFLF